MNPRGHDERLDLGGTWAFAVSERRVELPWPSADPLRDAGLTAYPATVPGNLELDLFANGLVDEPFRGMNIVGLRRYEHVYAYYFTTFDAPERPGTSPYLVFEGIDCFADVLLNGQLVHRGDNMLVEQHVPVAGVIRANRPNTLCVVIEPAVDRARSSGHDYPPGLEAQGSGYEGLYVRKAPHMYGWDIMPRAVSAGLWRPVSLRYLPDERLDWAWLVTEHLADDHGAAGLALHYRAIVDGDPSEYEILVSGSCGPSRFDRRAPMLFDAGRIRFTVPEPRLWWPRGRGEPDLYEVTVTLLRGGRQVDRLTLTHGIRTIELDRTSVTTPDGDGEFCVLVNGERIFVLGTNWVPVDAYHSRDRERIPRIVDMVDDLGCNMIRCWGGNVYEDDAFFDLCDRKGILVWQDFAMACAVYPQDDEFGRRLADEVRQVVRRLRQHACLAVWVGDNECDETWVWGGRRRDPNGNVLTREVIPAVLAEEDPSRPYVPSSPYVDSVAFRSGDRLLPEDHLWGPRGYFKGSFYTDAVCHFASEIGYFGCPAPESLARFLSPDRMWPFADNEEWLLHSTAPLPGVDLHAYRVALMASQVRALFGEVPGNLADYAFASQVAQAEALKFFIERFRAGKWRRTGIIWWNVIDGWPQLSDAIVDYYFTKKRAYDVVKRSQAPLCLVLREPAGGAHEIVACNDTRADLPLSFSVLDLDTAEVVAQGEGVAAADAVTVLGTVPAPVGLTRALLIEWTAPIGPGRNHYLAGSPPLSLSRVRSWLERAGL